MGYHRDGRWVERTRARFALILGNVMAKENGRPGARDRSSSSAVLATDREVSLARMLLHLVDVLGCTDRCDIELIDDIKVIAEPIVRSRRA